MAEPAPTVRYTGTETCTKCGAAASDITTGYDDTKNWIELQCRRCTNKWLVLPLDSAP